MKIHLSKIVEEHGRKCELVVDILADELKDHTGLMQRIIEKMNVDKIEQEEKKLNEQFKQVVYDEIMVPGDWEKE